MSFPRSNSKTKTKPSISAFGDCLSQIADATTNLSEDDKYAASLLNISENSLSKMMLSSDPEQINCVTLIKNLSRSIKEYEGAALPEQLTQRITQLSDHISLNPLNEDTLPSYISILCPRPPVVVLDYNYAEEYGYGEDYDPGEEEYDRGEEVHDNPEPASLSIVSEGNIKNDVCVICFINLNEHNDDNVVETVCKHQYHKKCINKFLKKTVNIICPCCKESYLHNIVSII